MSNRPLVIIGTQAPGLTTIPSFASDGAFEASKGSVGAGGDQYYNTTIGKLRLNENGVWTNIVTNLAYLSKSANYTALVTDRFIAANTASAWTLSLPTAVGNLGLFFEVVKTTSDLNALTITDGGSFTTTLNTQNESIIVISDGSVWTIFSRRIPSTWVSYTPTGLWSTNCTFTGRWRRVGDSIDIDIKVAIAGVPGTAGLAFAVALPATLLINQSKCVAIDPLTKQFPGAGAVWDNSATTTYPGIPTYGGVNFIGLNITNDAAAGVLSANLTDATLITFAANDFIVLTASGIPVTGWNG